MRNICAPQLENLRRIVLIIHPVSEVWNGGREGIYLVVKDGVPRRQRGQNLRLHLPQMYLLPFCLRTHPTHPSNTCCRVIKYSASEYKTTGNSYLAVYGVTRDPITEYYILESYGTYSPTTVFAPRGTLSIENSTYDIGYTYRVLPIEGQSSIWTYYSVRRDKRTSGSVDVGAHIKAWKDAGLPLGNDMGWQIVACEGYMSTGRCTVEIEEGERVG